MMLRPLATFGEIHPPCVAFAAVSRWEEVRLVLHEPWQTEPISGSMMSCLGRMPAICHRNVATETALDFLRLSGIEPPPCLDTYGSVPEAAILARRIADTGLRLATALPHAPEIRAVHAALVAPALLNALNDKSNIVALCPAAVVPPRRIYGRDAVAGLSMEAIRFPVFLKGAVERASGAGMDVRPCATATDFADALSWFRAHPEFKALIVEAAIPFVTTWCLNYAVLDREVRYLGAAEQIFARPGVQSGSVIDPDNLPPPRAISIGREICSAAQDRAYRGIAGLDMGVTAEGQIYFFDLNFRLASSTCFILLHEGVGDRYRVGVMAGISVPGALADLLPRLTDLAVHRLFVPLMLYDGSRHDSGPAPSRIVGFVRGEYRRETEALADAVKARLAG
jgi:hypothetical protein